MEVLEEGPRWGRDSERRGGISEGDWPTRSKCSKQRAVARGRGADGFVCFLQLEKTQPHCGLTGIISWRGQRQGEWLGQSPQVHGTSGPLCQ